MKRYYEIVRFTDTWPDQENYYEIEKLVRRGWFRKALEYINDWNLREDSISAARMAGRIWETPTDPGSPTDSIIYQSGDLTLCHRSDKIGLYQSYYLVGVLTEED